MVTEKPSNGAFAVGDLARLVQVHQPGREHLGVDTEVAMRTIGEHLGHRARNAADASLQRAPVTDIVSGVIGNGDLHCRWFGIDQFER